MELVEIWNCDLEKAYELQSSFEKNENGFENNAYGYSFEEFKKYVDEQKDMSLGKNLKSGYVPATAYILNDNGKYVGIFNLRHFLNESLENGAGHIGYGVSKIYRNKGYGSNGLRLTLEKAKNIGIDEVYMSVLKNNEYSIMVQKKNGAYIHHEGEERYYTRIKL